MHASCGLGGVGGRPEREGFGFAELVDELRRWLEAVLDQQVQVVALVEHLDPGARVELAEPARLAILLGHELLVERRDLDVEVVRAEIEVGRETLHRVVVDVAFEGERPRLVLPVDAVEVEELGELALRVAVSYTHLTLPTIYSV